MNRVEIATLIRIALCGTADDTRCGRETRRGTPCARTRAYGIGTCIHHADAESRQKHLRLRRDARRQIDAWRAARAPACAGWAVTTDDRAAVAQLALCADEVEHTREALRLLWLWQQGRCAMCGRSSRHGVEDMSRVVEDHDHMTGIVRGWLCVGCNVSEGSSGDGVANGYRANPPAAMLGIRVRY